MRRPNFFIVGAPKCGTTALRTYVGEHPEVCVSALIEPHYFAPDIFEGYNRFGSEDEYLKLCFSKAREKHKAVGDRSVFYLYSSVAAGKIREFDPSARVIVMLRNPVEMVYALHFQLLLNLDEDVTDFREAWELQEDRRRGKRIPRACNFPKALLYRDVGLMGSQLEHFYGVFPKEQVLPVVFDDFKADTRKVYERVLHFLDVSPDGRRDFPRINLSKVQKSRFIARTLGRPPRRLRDLYYFWRRKTGWRGLERVHKFLIQLGHRRQDRKPLDPEMRILLVDAFREDVEKLEHLLNRDLGHWLAT